MVFFFTAACKATGHNEIYSYQKLNRETYDGEIKFFLTNSTKDGMAGGTIEIKIDGSMENA